MRHHDKGQAGQTPARCLSFRKRKKFIRANRDRGNTLLFQMDTVMDTPRRAGSSVADSRGYYITLCNKLVGKRRRCTRLFLEPDKFFDIKALR